MLKYAVMTSHLILITYQLLCTEQLPYQCVEWNSLKMLLIKSFSQQTHNKKAPNFHHIVQECCFYEIRMFWVEVWNKMCMGSFTLQAEPSRTEPIRLGKQTHVMKWKHSHCTPNRTEPNRMEPDRACSLADVCFYLPADDRFCCAVGLTSGGRIACF